MSLLQLLQQAQGGQGISSLANQLGMDPSQADQLTSMLAPTLGKAVMRRAETDGLDAVMGQFKGEAQAGYYDAPDMAASDEGQAQGQQLLDSLLGSQDASNGLAAEAATRAGVDPALVMKFLPAIAAMLMGGMQKSMPDNQIDEVLGQFGQAFGGGSSNPMGDLLGGVLGSALGGASQSSAGGGLMDMLGGMMGQGGQSAAPSSTGNAAIDMMTSMLDQDGDGSALDDVLERFMK